MIDCDVHNSWSSSSALLPYLDPAFRDFLERGELPGGRDSFPHAHRPWLHPEGFTRTDAVPAGGATPGSDYELLREQLLDRYDVEYAILTGDEAIEVSTLAHPHLASALARAANDWTLAEWLPRDSRLKASLVVAPQDPAGAAEVDLPIAAHLGGQGGVNANPTGCGPPTFFWETHALLCETGMGHIGSLIAQGVFEKFPNLKFVLIECGVAWLGPILWRLDADYKALRKETPWLRRLPSEYAAEHIRLTTQPLEQPTHERHLWAALEAIDGEKTLLFASDYPHWDFDDPATIRLPSGWRERVFSENAREVYRLPAKRTGSEAATVGAEVS